MNLFYEILVDPVNSFMEILEKGRQKSSTREVFESIIAEFKELLKNSVQRKKIKSLKKKERNQFGGRSETFTITKTTMAEDYS